MSNVPCQLPSTALSHSDWVWGPFPQNQRFSSPGKSGAVPAAGSSGPQPWKDAVSRPEAAEVTSCRPLCLFPAPPGNFPRSSGCQSTRPRHGPLENRLILKGSSETQGPELPSLMKPTGPGLASEDPGNYFLFSSCLLGSLEYSPKVCGGKVEGGVEL